MSQCGTRIINELTQCLTSFLFCFQITTLSPRGNNCERSPSSSSLFSYSLYSALYRFAVAGSSRDECFEFGCLGLQESARSGLSLNILWSRGCGCLNTGRLIEGSAVFPVCSETTTWSLRSPGERRFTATLKTSDVCLCCNHGFI